MSDETQKTPIHEVSRRSLRTRNKSASTVAMQVESLEARDVPSVTGVVFEDFNANGSRELNVGGNNAGEGTYVAFSERGLSGVTVTAYSAGNQVAATAVTDNNGGYTLNTAPGNYRLEFTNFPSNYVSGPAGPNSGTSVQFVADGGVANLGVLNPTQTVSSNNPTLVTSVYVFGDQVNGTNRDVPVVVDFLYNSGTRADDPSNVNYTQPTQRTLTVPAREVGTTLGLAYNPVTETVYANTFTKKHSGYGPDGINGNPTGVIYQIDPTGNGEATVFADLNALGLGTVAGQNFRAGYTGDDDYIRDSGNIGWDAVGKSSLGGASVSADGTRLYVMNLADRQLYALGINTQTNQFDGTFYRISIPNADQVLGATRGANDPDLRGDLRPFAVQVFNGKIYIGVVNTAESTQRRSDVFAYIFEATDTGSALNFNPTPIFTFDFALYGSGGEAETGLTADWQPWTPVYRNIVTDPNSDVGVYAQPWLTSLAFDVDGNVAIGLRDRSGDQFGSGQLSDPNSNRVIFGTTAGEVLRAQAVQRFNPSAGLRIENNGNLPGTSFTSGGANNNQGPGGGEFYFQDDLLGFADEVATGGVVQLPGAPDVLAITALPGRLLGEQAFASAGVSWYSNTTGEAIRQFRLYQIFTLGSLLGKSNGMGNAAALLDAPGIQIGNRLWLDTNNDGIQDPNEPALADVTVELYNAAGTRIGTTSTDENGNYYFSDTNVDGDLSPNTDYQVRIPFDQLALAGLSLTLTKTNSGINSDLRDSDAVTIGTNAVINVRTRSYGENIHTFDAGYTPNLPPPVVYSLGNRVWRDDNSNGVINGNEPGIDGVTVRLYLDANNDGTPDGASIGTTQTANGGYYRFDGLAAGNYIVEVDTTAQVLAGLSSTVDGGDPDNNIDSDDNGTVLGTGFVRSNPVTLGPGNSEPTNETDLGAGDPGAVNERSNLTVDFGFTPNVPPPPVVYSLGNGIWRDLNGNGILDPNEEPGIDDLTVRLYLDANNDGTPDGPAIATTVTTNSGFYRFDNLAAGTYIVEVDTTAATLNGFISTIDGGDPDNDIDNDDNGVVIGNGFVRSLPVTLGPGDSEPTNETDIGPGDLDTPNARSNLSVDFGFRPDNSPPVYSLGNRVWRDNDANGVINNNEPGIDGVTVRLYLDANNDGIADGASIATTQTANGGYYRFDSLAAGTYIVEVDTTAAGLTGLISTVDGGDPDNDIDSDDNGTVLGTGFVRSNPVTLGPGNGEPTNETDLGSGDPGAINERSNLTIDFGFRSPPPPVVYSLGNRVWRDNNRDGILDANEPKLDGVTIRLYADANNDGIADGAAIATTQTADGGYYRFDGLAAGNYIVEVDSTAQILAGLFSTIDGGDPDNDIDNDSNGVVIGNGFVRSLPVTLGPGDSEPTNETDINPTGPGAINARSNLDVDFGFAPPPPAPPVPLRLGNLVFEDRNNDGRRQEGEPGIANVRVNLYRDSDNNGVADGPAIATTTTNSAGNYLFDDLTADTYIVEVVGPAGFSTSTGGFSEPASDPDNDIDNDDNGTLFNGNIVRALPVTLTVRGEPINDGDTNPNSNLSVDFGFYRLLELGNRVFQDTNNNGFNDPNEQGIDNIPVELYLDANNDNVPDSTTPLKTTTTANGGFYTFTGLQPGNYIVQIRTPSNFVSSSGTVNSLTGPFEPGPDPDNNVDLDDNGRTISPGVIRAFSVTLTPGDEPVDGYINPTVDFGLVPVSPPPTLSLGNLVFNDLNDNGLRDANEVGINGVAVRLLQNGTVINSTVTSGGGFYLFTGLQPGDYTVELTTPDGFVSSSGINGPRLTEPGIDSNTDIDNDDNGTNAGRGRVVSGVVTLTRGGEPTNDGDNDPNTNLTVDFGLIQPQQLAEEVGLISGYVYIDTRATNGLREFGNGEKGIGGTTVNLSGITATGIVINRTMNTDRDGFYEFRDLPRGTYEVREVQPRGFFIDGIDTAGTVGSTVAGNDFLRVELPSGAASRENNFGEVLPFTPSGYVYVDLNKNGTRDSGEPGVPGVNVTVQGTAFPGTPLERPLAPITIPTNELGYYQFTSLPPGTYTITAINPPGFIDGVEENVDPNGPFTILVGSNTFANVTPSSQPLRGPLNFSLQLPEVPRQPNDTSKRSFLASTPDGRQVRIEIPDFGSSDVVGDSLPVPLAPRFEVNTGNVNVPQYVATGTGVGLAPTVRVFDYSTGNEVFRFDAYESTFTGGVHVATGDIDGDGIEDIITAPGTGGGPLVKVFSGVDGSLIRSFFAYAQDFRDGVFVAVGDVNGDGRADIITGPDVGGGPHVRAFDGVTGGELLNYFAYDSSFRGGVRVAAGDINNDGFDDIITGAGAGGAAHIKAFDARTGQLFLSFFSDGGIGTGGAFVASGDINGDGVADIIVAPGVGDLPVVKFYNGTGTQTGSLQAYDSSLRTGINVTATDIDGDGIDDLITAPGQGGTAQIRFFDVMSSRELDSFWNTETGYVGGAFVG